MKTAGLTETYRNASEVPLDYESREFVYRSRDSYPPRPRSLSAALSLMKLPIIGRRFAPRVAHLFRGTGRATLLPDFKCLFANLIVGEGVALHDAFCVDYAPIVLHDGARLSFRNMLITSTHDLDDFSIVIAKPIVLERNVWVTSGCIILGGVRIGENSVIAAGSVVTKSIPSNVLAGGNPAKVIKAIR